MNQANLRTRLEAIEVGLRQHEAPAASDDHSQVHLSLNCNCHSQVQLLKCNC